MFGETLPLSSTVRIFSSQTAIFSHFAAFTQLENLHNLFSKFRLTENVLRSLWK